MASQQPVKLTSPSVPTQEQEVDALGNALVAGVGQTDAGAALGAGDRPVIAGGEDPAGNAQRINVDVAGNQMVVGPDADGAAATGNPVVTAGVDGSGNVQAFATDPNGVLQVSVGAGGTKVMEFGDTGIIVQGAANTADVDTADIAATNGALLKILVASEQPFYCTIWTVQNGVETQRTGRLHGDAGETLDVEFASDAITLTGGSAGLDAFRLKCTNNDNNKAAQIDVTFCYITS